MSTWADLFQLALLTTGVIGQGQTASAEDISNCKRFTNQLLSQWQRKRWLVYHLIDVHIPTTGALSYSVGPGGDFDTPRPDRIEAAFFRQITSTQPVDYMLQIIEAREDYDRIILKTMGTWPSLLFYDSAYPLGYVYVWPVPQSGAFELHLSLKQTLGQVGDITDDIELPPEYEAAILYNLAARLRPAYGMTPDATITALALDGTNVLRNTNAQLSTLLMPNAVVGRRRMYNVYSDS